MSRFIKIAIATGALILASGGAAVASNDYCGASATGCGSSMDNTPCAEHGSFGAFGKDNNFAGGANGQQAGYANSHLCGHPNG